MASQHRPGVNKALSIALPTAMDKRVDTELEAFLQANSIYETEEGEKRRATVVNELESMLRQWVLAVGERKGSLGGGLEETSLLGAGQLHVFGSQRLGVHGTDSDVDVLCVCPQFITRQDFFGSFCDCLRESEHASMVLAVPEAYTPVVKFNYMSQPVDMIFVSLPLRSIPQDIDLLNDAFLKEQDEKGVRSLNGVRVAEHLVKAVPNVTVFRSSLRAIKFWGRRRGIYSNVLGVLGGINFALMVAFICQLHPNACMACIVQRFFKIYFHWQWPNPIMIAAPVDYLFGNTSSWNYVQHLKDRADLMPIITPAFPQMNSAYNMSPPQFRVIQVTFAIHALCNVCN
jgi:poly(A) polymerase